MTKFEDLPANVQALLFARLAMELNTLGCATVYDIAKKRRTDITGVWSDICRKAGQLVCTIPTRVMYPNR